MSLYKIDVFTFNDLTKRIVVDAGITLLTVQRIYNACRLYEAEPAFLDNLSLCRASGKDPLGGNKFVGITMTMLDGWQIEMLTTPSEIFDGNFLGEDAAGDSQNPIFGAVVTRSLDTSAALELVGGDVQSAVWGAPTADYKVAGSFGAFIQKLLTISKFLSLK